MGHQLMKTLWEQRTSAALAGNAILDRAQEEKRDLTSEEQESFDRSHADMKRLDERMETIKEAEERTRNAEASYGSFAGAASKAEKSTDLRSKMVDVGPEGEIRSKSFVVKPTQAEREELRTLTKATTNTAGSSSAGQLIPTTFYNSVVQHLIEVSSIMMSGPTIINTSGGEPLNIPKTTGYGTAAIVGEAGVIPASDPGFSQVQLNAFKYGHLVQASHELVNDTAFDLQGFIAMETGRALGNAFGGHLVNGAGTTEPLGIVSTATTGVTGATTGQGGVFTAKELIDLKYSVISPYRNSPSVGWLMRDATVAKVRQLVDSQGQFLWQPSLQLGSPDILLGDRIRTDPNVPAVAVNAKSVFYGDWSRIFVRVVEGLRFERSDEYGFNTDTIFWRALWRGDGALVDTTGGIKCFRGAAT